VGGLTWDSVFAWRMRQQFLDTPASMPASELVTRLCGVQAQVASSADLAIALRQAEPRAGEPVPGGSQVEQALADKALVKTWAMRGTLHLLPAALAGEYLSLVASARTWEKGAWQRTFLTTEQLAVLTEVVAEALDAGVLTREELIERVTEQAGDDDLTEQLRSGWSVVLKPLAWQGLLCQGPSQGGRVTFARPDRWLPGWRGLPDPMEAARVVVPAYLAAYGPATMEAFDQWLVRGVSKKAALRRWFAGLGEELVTVDVQGVPAYARARDVDEIAATRPSEVVRLLPGFDQYVLGPGTADAQLIAPARRGEVSRTAGWISPVVIVGGRVAGTWQTRTVGGADMLDVTLFVETGPVSPDALQAEADRIGRYLGSPFRLSVRTS
jgi:hypothetical protein